MSIQGWYYLHENGSLIYKREFGGAAADIRESDFAKSMWPMDPQDREGAWRIIVEAGALGANKARVDELAALWHCNDADALHYAAHIGCELVMDGNAWCARPLWFEDLPVSPAGFGDTCLEALTDLCREMGFKGGKMWSLTFADLLQQKTAVA
jgi:hypothetical protein